jgi:arsenate reductase (glutaredoxin)
VIKIYHNPRCRKSRAGLDYLKSKTTDFEMIDYIKSSISETEIREILLKTKLPIESLLRKQEEIYKTHIRNKTLSEDELITLILQFPNLMQRPIVLSGNHAVIADPPETINNIL